MMGLVRVHSKTERKVSPGHAGRPDVLKRLIGGIIPQQPVTLTDVCCDAGVEGKRPRAD